MPAPSDLVHETTASTGTGNLTLSNVNGKRSFNTAFGTGGSNVFDYFISNRDAAEWERGTGSLSAATTLVRDTVIASSNANAAVNFSAGTKDVTNDIPAANQARLDAAQTWSAQQTFAAAVNLTSGQIAFPASQSASADANTLDDYEEGTWTPTLTFDTPGDLSVSYSTQSGGYTKIGRAVVLTFQITTSTFTHTTASGSCRITGIPFTAANVGGTARGALAWQGVTKANYTDGVFSIVQTGGTTTAVVLSGSGQTAVVIAAADMPSGGTVLFASSILYLA